MDLVIVGPGKVGQMLARLASAAGIEVSAIVGRTLESARVAAEAAGFPEAIATTIERLSAPIDRLAITVRDDVVAEVAAQLAAARVTAGDGAFAFHCSGRLDADALAPLRARGFRTGSLHPLKTIPDPDAAAASFTGTPCAIEGEASDGLDALTIALGGTPFRLPTGGKALYHAGAVIASNYLVTLAHLATTLYGHLDIPRADALAMLLPLLRGTVESLGTTGLPGALTGPIERGDAGTLLAHLTAIRDAEPTMLPVWRELAAHTIRVAVDKGSIDETAADRLRGILQSGPPGPPATGS